MEKIEQSLYEILGVSQNATLKEIKIAYRQKAMEYHPNMNPSKNNGVCHKMMCKINDAYNTLKNPDLRVFYDATLFEKDKYAVSNEEVRHHQKKQQEMKTKLIKEYINLIQHNITTIIQLILMNICKKNL